MADLEGKREAAQAASAESLVRPAERDRENGEAQSGLVSQFGQRRKSNIPRK